MPQIEEGSIDANIGGGIIKQGLARVNQCKSGGYRTVIVYRIKDVSFSIFGFTKSERENITKDELKLLKEVAKMFLNYNKRQIEIALTNKKLREIKYE